MGGTEHRRPAAAWLGLALVAMAPSAWAQTLACDVGALDRVIGGGQWRVHGCSDGSSLVVVALAGNPASPFFFFLHRDGDAYGLTGEGTGDATWTKRAYEELAAMDFATVSTLNDAVRATVKGDSPQP